jgi:hypothetical protein
VDFGEVFCDFSRGEDVVSVLAVGEIITGEVRPGYISPCSISICREHTLI